MKKQPATIDKRLDKIEDTLSDLNSLLKKLAKEIDMTQKIVHVESASNAIRIEQELKKKIIELHNKELEKMDHIMGELETFRDENTIGAYQIKELRDEIASIVKRISILEKTQTAS